ncbi:MAG: glycerate kinase [Candidatus Nanoarchaeia archaeon]
MKILIAPNSFKGSLTAIKAAEIIKKALCSVKAQQEIITELLPISDGGDGLLNVFLSIRYAKKIKIKVSDPLGRKIESFYGFDAKNKTAIIEMALASGLALLNKHERNPLIASTAGTGELILDAIRKGAKKIILGIGGSATCDCGIGALSALGFKFFDKNKKELEPFAKNLPNISKILCPKNLTELKSVKIVVACDVENPLIGKKGAAHVYAPQKGANEEDMKYLDKGLTNFAKVIKKLTGVSIADMKGAGAAGGIGATLHALLGAKLSKGTQIVFEELKIEEKLKDADLVITGEGQIDFQTVFGKAPAELAKIAKKYNKPCIAFCGSYSGSLKKLHKAGITAVFSICKGPSDLQFCIRNAAKLLEEVSEQVFRLLFNIQRPTAYPAVLSK